MPWQQYVADVAGEFDPVTGRPFYRTVLVSTPRQQGKSILLLSKMLERCTLWPEPQVCVYTAQNGFEAGKKVIKSWHPQVKRSKLRRVLEQNANLGLRKAAGNQGIDFVNGSRIDVQASAEASGHGDTIDDGNIDEAWHDSDYRREQALRPAMLTREQAQLWVVSTAGTDASVYWNATQDAGRLAAQDDTGHSVCYFEWSCPDDVDPLDPAGWHLYMPALGHKITVETVQADIAALQLEPSEIARAYGNRRQTTGAEAIIPKASWAVVCNPQAAPAGTLSFALDVNPEYTGAALVACGDRTVEVIAHLADTRAVIDKANELSAKYGTPVLIDASGPADSIASSLRSVRKVKGREFAAACGAFYLAVADRDITVRRHPNLDAAVDGAARRPVGEAWAWARKSTSVDISPLVAATLAWWANTAEGASVYEDRGLVSL